MPFRFDKMNKNKILVLCYCFVFYVVTSLPLFAQSVVDSLKKELTTAKEDTLKIIIQNKLGNLLSSSDEKQTLYYLNEALQLSQKIKYAKGITDAYNSLGLYYATLKSDYPKAISYFKKLLGEYEKKGDKAEISRILSNIGAVYQMQGDYTSSLDYFLKALRYCRQMDQCEQLSTILVNISSNYRFQEDYKKALDYNQQAIKAAKEKIAKDTTNISYKKSYAYSLLTLGVIYHKQKEYDKALKSFFESYQINEKTENKYELANLCNNIGNVYADMSDYKKALHYYQLSLDYRKSLGENIGTARSLTGMAEIYFKNNDYHKSIAFAKRGYTIAQAKRSKELIKYSSEILYKNYKARHRPDSALFFYEMYSLHKDSLFSDEKSKEIGRLESRFELEKKETENNLLRKDKELKEASIKAIELNIEKHKDINIGIGVTLALLIILVIVLYRSNQQKQKNNSLLKEAQEEMLVQNEDIKNQKEEWERLNHVKDRILSIISHDFRSPLNSLQGTLHLLDENLVSEEEFKAIAKGLAEKVQNTSSLLDNLLHWAKNQIDGLKITPATFSVKMIADENIRLLKPQAEKKVVVLDNHIKEDLNGYADADMIRLVFRNLISNAIKFTKKDDLISLNAIEKDGFIQVSVIDTGTGISTENKDKLFNFLQRICRKKWWQNLGGK